MTTEQHIDRQATLLSLPFDQHGRYSILREALEAVRPLVGARLRILDVGGYYQEADGTPRLTRSAAAVPD